MKILIDSSLTQNEKWFTSFPVFINDKEDTNNEEHIPEIIENKNNRTAYLSFEKIKQNYIYDSKEKVIIFTIPSSMSGQYNVYKNQNKSKNILILEGAALFTKKNDFKEILKKNNAFENIEKEINELNEQVDMTGIVLNSKTLNLRGRIHALFAMLIKTANVKIKMKWKDGKWVKEKVSLNGTSLIKDTIQNKKVVHLICSNIEETNANKIIKRIQNNTPNLIIEKQIMTNSMLAHSGKDFVVIY